MKKLTLSVLAFTLSASFLQAQQVGIKAGLNYSSLSGDDANDFDYRLGGHIGGIIDMAISDLFSFQPEIVYSMKGYRNELVETATSNFRREVIAKGRFHYLDIPLLFKAKAGGLFFELGPQVSFTLAAKQEIEIITTNNNRETTTVDELKMTDDLYPVDFGYAAGIGYRAESGLGIGLRYNGGLKDVFDEGSLEDQKIRNSTFQLSVSYLLGNQ